MQRRRPAFRQSTLFFGDITVTTQVFMFKKIKISRETALDMGRSIFLRLRPDQLVLAGASARHSSW